MTTKEDTYAFLKGLEAFLTAGFPWSEFPPTGFAAASHHAQSPLSIFLWDTLSMLQFDPKNSGDTSHKLQRAIKESGLTPQQVCDRLKSKHEVKLSPSSQSRSISHGTIRLQLALRVLAICGVIEVGIKGVEKGR